MKTTRSLLTVILALFAYFTSYVNGQHKANDNFLPCVIDSLPEAEKVFMTDYMPRARNHFVYNGPLSDTVKIKDHKSNAGNNYFVCPEVNVYPTQALKLTVSRSHSITICLPDSPFPPAPVYKKNTTPTDDFFASEIDSAATAEVQKRWHQAFQYYQATPVFIYNSSQDTIPLYTQDGDLSMIQEAKDELGVWRPIEYWLYSDCGNSYETKSLLPKNIAIVKVLKYAGSFETDIRIKFRNGKEVFYSGTYKGTINKSQFNLSEYDKEYLVSDASNLKKELDRLFLK